MQLTERKRGVVQLPLEISELSTTTISKTATCFPLSNVMYCSLVSKATHTMSWNSSYAATPSILFIWWFLFEDVWAEMFWRLERTMLGSDIRPFIFINQASAIDATGNRAQRLNKSRPVNLHLQATRAVSIHEHFFLCHRKYSDVCRKSIMLSIRSNASHFSAEVPEDMW